MNSEQNKHDELDDREIELSPEDIEKASLQRDEGGEKSEAEKKDTQLTIKLPDDSTRVADLESKLEEYKNRLEKQKGKNLDTVYKTAVLGKLLSSKSKEVNIEDIAKELSDVHRGINRKDFENAVGVIYDYVNTGGNLTKPGMGLKRKNDSRRDIFP